MSELQNEPTPVFSPHQFTEEQSSMIRETFLAWCEANLDKTSPLLLGLRGPSTPNSILEAAESSDDLSEWLLVFSYGLMETGDEQVAILVGELESQIDGFRASSSDA